jgi:serine/threonine protein kinase/HEAT repeat protein
MGSVYLAHDTQLDRRVALKVPHIDPDGSPLALERFYREARAAATLHHPNLCPVYDAGQIDGVPYLTMAYVEGRPLTDFIDPKKPVAPRQAAALVRKLALALQEAHAKGVVHRDLKPGNVMITTAREPVVLDFGLARLARAKDMRLTQTGRVMGTPAYMPPEQVLGDVDAMGPGCDVYSLGVMLYELLTGRVPFEGTGMGVLALILTAVPQPPSALRPGLDARLEAICLKAMAKQAADRYASMSALAAALQDYLRGSSSAAPAPAASSARRTGEDDLAQEVFADLAASPAYPAGRASRPRRSRRWPWLVAAAALLAVSAGVLPFVVKRGDNPVSHVQPRPKAVVTQPDIPSSPKGAPPTAPAKSADGGKNRELLLGKWESLDPKQPGTIEFRPDGAVVVVMGGTPEAKGTYQFLQENTVEITLTVGGQKVSQKLKIDVTKDRLTTTDEHNKVDQFRHFDPQRVASRPAPAPPPAPPVVAPPKPSVVRPLPDAPVADLRKALKDKDPAVQERAAAYLAKRGPAAAPAVADLAEVLKNAQEVNVRRNAAIALGSIGSDSRPAVPALAEALRPEVPVVVREHAAEALARIRYPSNEAALAVLFSTIEKDPEPRVRQRCVWALFGLGDLERPGARRILSAVLEETRDDGTLLRCDVARLLAYHLKANAPDRVANILLEMLQNKTLKVANASDVRVAGDGAVATQVEATDGADARFMAAEALGWLGKKVSGRKAVIDALKEAAKDADPKLQEAARAALKTLGIP